MGEVRKFNKDEVVEAAFYTLVEFYSLRRRKKSWSGLAKWEKNCFSELEKAFNVKD